MYFLYFYAILLSAVLGDKKAITICILVLSAVLFILLKSKSKKLEKHDNTCGDKASATDRAVTSLQDSSIELDGFDRADEQDDSIDREDYDLSEQQAWWARETWDKWNDPSYDEHPWYSKKEPFTPRELKEYWTLLAVAKEFGLFVFPKVGLIDLLRVKSEEKEKQDEYRPYIWSKHVDFTLWSPRSRKVICIIELLDNSHDGWRGEYRDPFVRGILKEAGYIYYELSSFNQDELRQLIRNALLGKNEERAENQSYEIR